LVNPSDFFADNELPGAAEFSVAGPAWRWRAADPTKTAAWYFLTVSGDDAAGIRAAALGRTGGFGSIRVTAQIGGTRWQTSLFPSKDPVGWLLPLKADVRRREGIEEGTIVAAILTL
jgi:Domain of unknown function (DUF1905)